MELVPQIISTKDFAYLSDMFEWNYNAFKQVSHFINEVNDNEVKNLLERVKNMHEDHLYYIISILKKDEFDQCACEECDCEECSCVEDEDDE